MPIHHALSPSSALLVLLFFLTFLFFLSAAFPGTAFAQTTEVRISQIAEGLEAGSGEIQHFTQTVPVTLSPRAGAPVSETLGEQRTLVSLVNFTNDPSTPALASDIDFDILDPGNPDSSASYILEASYGRAWLSGSVQDWFSASFDDSACALPQQAVSQQLIDELDPSVDFSLVDRWIIVTPANVSCGFLGLSTLGKWTWDTDEGSVSFSRVIMNGVPGGLDTFVSHELGHSFNGLQHALDHECGLEMIGGSECEGVGSDFYSVMGGASWHGHYTPPSKESLGWFDGEVLDVPPPGGTYLLEPYETVGTGTKVLRIPAPSYTGDYDEGRNLYVSYRKPLGFDAIFTDLAVDGAMLHLDAHYFPGFTSVATAASRLLDASPGVIDQGLDSSDSRLEVGESIVDTVHGITIETLGVVGGLLEVQVTIDQWCGNGVKDASYSEACDGADLGGKTCETAGFTSGTLSCSPSCTYDVGLCGAAQCAAGDSYDDTTQRCTAILPSVAPADMNLYRNASSWSVARTTSVATLLTAGRGFFASVQNFSGTGRSILHRLMLPFDTSPLPDGAVIESATLRLKLDSYPEINNTHPDQGDQLVLVQTSDPTPTIREETDYGTFLPIDFPDEGAARVDVGDSLSDGQEFSMPLNATGISWIDDTSITKLGMRSGYDVDDLSLEPAAMDFRLGIIPATSPIAGPRLEVEYRAIPEPGTSLGLLCGGALLAYLQRRRGGRLG